MVKYRNTIYNARVCCIVSNLVDVWRCCISSDLGKYFNYLLKKLSSKKCFCFFQSLALLSWWIIYLLNYCIIECARGRPGSPISIVWGRPIWAPPIRCQTNGRRTFECRFLAPDIWVLGFFSTPVFSPPVWIFLIFLILKNVKKKKFQKKKFCFVFL